MVLIDTNQLDYGGITHDPVASIVLFGANHIVDTTICSGEVVVENGRLTRVDEDEIVARANQLSREYLARASRRTGIDYSQAPPKPGGHRSRLPKRRSHPPGICL